jgi:hypothetical protein
MGRKINFFRFENFNFMKYLLETIQKGCARISLNK